MSAGTCKHAASGCDYPASECGGSCTAKVSDGGPAFPVECQFGADGKLIGGIQTGNRTGWMEGMTLRDYFAAKTLPACIAVATEALASGRVTMSDEQAADLRRAICIDAWGWADEMLAARGTQS
ncbi:hypothetical protein [Cupriavidus sp.]|uniref:hypothetical protein n=1 Tax=Cupriavidus sp. TaxID=1873897 RepID=UPI0025B8D927|nr:hypothetical protein [Cupriavidus sp.]MCA3190948.1 hypothetical protein [Cupriavidus sp.]MCA3199292.1 hypothetical protein [Cupriavidus sp.]MCA3204559.1 hypothetical protein [Cupriavidus sp.]